jgi:hypothetical protein
MSTSPSMQVRSVTSIVDGSYSGRLQRAQMDVAELTPDTTFRL